MDRCPRIRSDTLAQAVRLGEVVTQNPLHQGPAIPEAPPALSMLNSLLSAGEPLALGSDAGPNEAKPILNIMVASTCESSPQWARPPIAGDIESRRLNDVAGVAGMNRRCGRSQYPSNGTRPFVEQDSQPMLFEPDRHEALCDAAWDEALASATIRAIARDIEQNQGIDGHWPLHPLDDAGDEPQTGFKSLYLGRAGVLWALCYLQRAGAITLNFDPAEGMQRADAAYQADPDTGRVAPSYFLGEVGILLVLWRLTGSARAADRLYASVRSNVANPTHEAFWGASGTMLAAWHLWQATGEARWRALFLENVEQVWQNWVFDAKANCHLWTQNLYGKTVQYLGAGHGFAGNVHPLLKGASLLDADRRQALYARCVDTLRATAKFEDGAVNWPPGTYVPRPDGPRMLMQWCHGAPGIVTGLSDFPLQVFPEMDAMLIAAGHAVWQAGPLAKGYGLCHGTAGNGHALLKLYQRTGDSLWLGRARRFAVHAITQRDRLRQAHGQGRYTLWTGEPGLAVYLWQCIKGSAGLPVLDILQ